jgi:hypothetical protein
MTRVFSLLACFAVISAMCAIYLFQSHFFILFKAAVLAWRFFCLFLARQPALGQVFDVHSKNKFEKIGASGWFYYKKFGPGPPYSRVF